MAKRYWLMKSEPDVYSIEDLERDGRTHWDGVRNPVARKNMESMQEGDLVFFYHSNAKPPGVAGIAEVVREAYPDPSQFDRSSPYHDPKATREKPRWSLVDVGFVERFADVVGLPEIKDTPELEDMVLVRNSRLSVQPVQKSEWDRIVRVGRRKT
ncbi:MAG: EVE domain-containing protein [Gemmatimonadota bacterium]|nr:EVE domain-containing protein [Gemmatimonadota bacterium]